jgi:hypothetical protein
MIFARPPGMQHGRQSGLRRDVDEAELRALGCAGGRRLDSENRRRAQRDRNDAKPSRCEGKCCDRHDAKPSLELALYFLDISSE